MTEPQPDSSEGSKAGSGWRAVTEHGEEEGDGEGPTGDFFCIHPITAD
jgi:hypothetical protein